MRAIKLGVTVHTEGDNVDTNTDAVIVLGKDTRNVTKVISADSRIDSSGKSAFNSVFGEQLTATRLPSSMTNAVYGLDVADVNISTTNGGTVTTDADSLMVVQSSTTVNGTARVESKRSLRYRPGCEGYVYFTAMFEGGGVVGATQFCGLLDTDNGYALGFDGLDFMVCRRKDGVNFIVKQENFNKDSVDGTGQSGFTLDKTKLNVYRITYGWLGAAPIYFEVMNNAGNWILMHVFELTGTLTTPHVTIPYLPMTIEVIKTSGVTNVITRSGSWGLGIVGQPSTVSDILSATQNFNISYLASGGETNLLTLRSKSTFNSLNNKIDSVFLHLTVATEGTKAVIFKIYKNMIITAPSYVDVNATKSIMEVDTVATVSGGQQILPSVLAKEASKDLDIEHLDIRLHPNETLTLTGESANNSTLTVGLNWREEF